MTRRSIAAIAVALGLAATFGVGFVTGQVSEAAYRFRNESALAIALPRMIESVQAGRMNRDTFVRLAVRDIETEIRFLQAPLSIYPHAPQSYERMPHRVAWLNRAIRDLERSGSFEQQGDGYSPPAARSAQPAP